MKKRILTFSVVMVLLFAAFAGSAGAAVQEAHISPSLYISGGTVYGSASIRDNGKAISATMELWCGGTKLDECSDSGTGYAFLSVSAAAESGKSYSLYVYGMIGSTPFSITPLTVNG